MIPCPVCLESTSSPLVTVADQPSVGCHFADSRVEALGAGRGTLELASCNSCGHVFNRAFEPERVAYGAAYENELEFSPRHRAHLEATVDRLIAGYQLRGKSVLEIGCGAAAFLSLLCARGGNHGIGYDPTQRARTMQACDGSVTIVADIFTGADHGSIDFVCAQHVLEHLVELNFTLRQARRALKPGGIGYFQVPNGLSIFCDLDIWDLTYEHVSYFSPASLHHALRVTGFSPLRLESSFGAEYLDAEAVADGGAVPGAPSGADYPELANGFSAAFAEHVASWKQRIATMVASGSRVVLWGAGTKAVSFLNMLAIGYDDGIEYVVDINPRKAGRFIPGTGQKIVTPEEMRAYSPDVIVVMNREYGPEIQSMVGSMRLRADLMPASSGAA